MTGTRTRVLVESGLSIGLAYVLGRFVLFKLPFGGSMSLDMLPIMVLALRRGWAPGLITGAIYGLLNYTLDPVQIVYPLQFLLDYAVAYGLVGLAGISAPAWKRALAQGSSTLKATTIATAGLVLGVVARFAAHYVSGVVYFGQYAPAGQPVWLYSLLYNGSYMLPSGIACIALAVVILPTLQKAVPVR
jgi:thiamine transporter